MQGACHGSSAHISIGGGLSVADAALGERRDYRAKASPE